MSGITLTTVLTLMTPVTPLGPQQVERALIRELARPIAAGVPGTAFRLVDGAVVPTASKGVRLAGKLTLRSTRLLGRVALLSGRKLTRVVARAAR